MSKRAMQVHLTNKLGRSLFVGSVIPWGLSSVMGVPSLLIIAFPIAWVIPRFLFRRLGAHGELQWVKGDWLWLGAALMISLASFFGLDPVTMVKAIIASAH